MKNFSLLILIMASVFLTACSGNPKNGATAGTNTTGKVCRYEKATGSNIGTRICRTPAQMEHEKKVAKEAMRTMRTGAVSGGDGA